MPDLAKLITQHLERSSIELNDLAKQLSVHRHTLYRWRQGALPRNPKSLRKLAEILGLDARQSDELLQSAFPAKHGDAIPSARSLDILSEEEPLIPVTTRPIPHPRQFFGHNALLKELFAAWSRSVFEHIAIIGGKAAGKTSLLNYLRYVHRVAAAQLRPGQVLPRIEAGDWVYVDFRDVRMRRQTGLLRHVAEALSLDMSEAPDLLEWADKLEHDLHRPLILLLDNVEYGLRAPELDQAFWEILRALGGKSDGYPIGFCVSSRIFLPELEAEALKHSITSPFFNTFESRVLGPFSEAEACELLNAGPLPLSVPDGEFILEISESRPVLLQKCYKAWLQAGGGKSGGWREKCCKIKQEHVNLL
ncbi:MAG: hypothetical protein GY862_36690 [Gammaproteobacteria bacterium]|nr:hypothetical protein [Gammaproteobacteria bacterium]